jgi:hypothetical protein
MRAGASANFERFKSTCEERKMRALPEPAEVIVLPMQGGCICGEVRYAVTGQPLLLSVCHCTTCQRRTGSAFAMTLVVNRAKLEVRKGHTITRDLRAGSGSISRHHFCNECLVRTHTEPARQPQLSYVRPGTLDDPSQVTPIAQIWTRSAQRWALNQNFRCYEANLDNAPEMIAAWQRAHPVAR